MIPIAKKIMNKARVQSVKLILPTDFICGESLDDKDPKGPYEINEIPENLKNKNYMEDSAYRENFKKWVEVIWVDKDESISNLKF